MPDAVVVDGAGQLDRRRAELLAQRGVDRRRRRLLDELLVAPLDRALPLAEVHDVAVLVGHHLDLDVAGRGQPPLGEHGRVAERGGGLSSSRSDGVGQLVASAATSRMPRPPPPAAALTSSG